MNIKTQFVGAQEARDVHPAGKGLDKHLTHAEVGTIVSKEVDKVGDLLSDGTLEIPNLGFERGDRADCCCRESGDSGDSATTSPDLLLHGDSDREIGGVKVGDINLGHETSPSAHDVGAHSVGDADVAGGDSASAADKVTDPAVSFRFDAALDMIAVSIDGEDDIYLPYATATAASRELSAELRIQAFTRRNRRTV